MTRAVLAAALAAGCTVEQGGDVVVRVDTVTVHDTVVRVDTLRIVDTVVALGDAAADETFAAAQREARLRAEGAGPDASATAGDLAYLRGRQLLVPVAGVPASRLHDTFDEMRGARKHAALDIPAPRGTPVLSTDDGKLVKLHQSVAGGITAYAEDPSGRFVYYYAHLDRYSPGIAEGMTLARGDTIGFVGSTGNAPPGTPHLHFAIARMDADRRWWKGTPIDPRPLFVGSGAAR